MQTIMLPWKTLISGTNRRRVLGVLAGGLTAALGGRRATVAHHKPNHCAKSRCKGHSIYGVHFVPCDLGLGTGCMCVLSVEGCRACVDENSCSVNDAKCVNSAECEARVAFGPGSVCQQPNSGACEQRCLKPCSV
jgi:hypothetical protein